MFGGLIHRIKLFDRRRFKRYRLELMASGNCSYKDGGRPVQCPIAVKNVSKNGLLVVTGNIKLYPNTPVQLRFQEPHSKTPIVILGMVVRTYRPNQEGFYRSGIKLQDPDTAEVRAFLDFIRKK